MPGHALAHRAARPEPGKPLSLHRDGPSPGSPPGRDQAGAAPGTGTAPAQRESRWVCFSQDADIFHLPRNNRHPGRSCCPACFIFIPPLDQGMAVWDASPAPGWGACTVMPAGSPSFPTAGCLPPTHRPPAGADSERKQKLFRVSGGGERGGEAKQNQAGYFKPDLISPLLLIGPSSGHPSPSSPSAAPLLGSFPGERAALLAPPTPPFL